DGDEPVAARRSPRSSQPARTIRPRETPSKSGARMRACITSSSREPKRRRGARAHIFSTRVAQPSHLRASRGRAKRSRNLREDDSMAKLYFRHGTMSSAKTLNLLAVAHNYRSQGKRVLLIKPKLDDRFSGRSIVSRAGIDAQADMLLEPDTVLDVAR